MKKKTNTVVAKKENSEAGHFVGSGPEAIDTVSYGGPNVIPCNTRKNKK